MSIKEVLLFMGQTKDDLSLQQEVKQLLGTGDGNICDGAALDFQEIAELKGEKAQAITQLAQTKGRYFLPQELIEVINYFEDNKLGKIDKAELFQSLGMIDIIDNPEQQEEIELVYRGQVYRKAIDERPATAAQINPKKEVVQFMHKSSEEGNWQKKIREILGIGDGNISSAAELDEAEAEALKGDRGAKVVEFAHKHRFYFSQPDLIDVVQMFQNHRQGKISETELFKNLGVSSDALALFSTQKVVKLMFKGSAYEKLIGEPSNPKIAVIQFMHKTGESESLQQELEQILGVGDGNISSASELDQAEAEALKGDRGVKVVEFARRQGLNFAQQDLVDVVQVFDRHRQGTISDLELYQLLELPTDDLVSTPTRNIQEYIYRGQRYKKIDGVIIPVDDPEINSISRNPKTQVVEFMEQTSQDKKLQKELQQILGVGDGDISSVTALDPQEIEALKGSKTELVKDLASQKGFQFSTQDLITVISAFQRHQAGDISEAELFASLGVSKGKQGFFDKVVNLLNRKVWN